MTTANFDVKSLEGKKATLVLINSIGFPAVRKVTIQIADIVSAKRYQGDMTTKTCLQLQYVEKGKRKPIATRFTESDLAVVLGWHDIKTPTEFMSFDRTVFDGMLAQVSTPESIVYKQYYKHDAVTQ